MRIISATTGTPSTAMRRVAQFLNDLQFERHVRTRTASFMLARGVSSVASGAEYTSSCTLGVGRSCLDRRHIASGILPKCALQVYALRLMDTDDTLKQERCASREAWDLARYVYKLKIVDKATFYSPAEAWVMPAPSEKLEEREFVVDSGASMHMLSKKDFKLRRKVQEPHKR